MPTVPSYGDPRVSQTIQPDAQAAAPTSTDYADKQTQDLGAAVQSAGQGASSIATEIQNQANMVRSIDAASAAREKLYDTIYAPQTGLLAQKGWNALNRDSGVDLATEYGQQFKKITDGISEGLSNDAQRSMFAQQATQMQTQLHATAEQHMGQEYQSYHGAVYDAAVKSDQNAIGLQGATNPGQINPLTGVSYIDEAAARIKAAVGAKARLDGLPQTAADNIALDAVSAAHKLAIDGLLEQGKYDQAAVYQQQYKDQLNASDSLDIAGKIDGVAGLQNGFSVIGKVMSNAKSSLQPNSFDLMSNITTSTESGNRQTLADGSPVTGYKVMPDGSKQPVAFGKWQVTDATGQQWAKEMGIPWDPQRLRTDEAYNSAIGQYGLQKLIQKNGGDPAKAWAAYNAGQGAVNSAVKQAQAAQAKGDTAHSNWTSYLPTETQNYVAKNMAQLQAGGGHPDMPTIGDVIAQVHANLPANTNPRVLQQIDNETQRQYNIIQQSKNEADAQSLNDAMTALRSNGGNMSALPFSVLSKVPANKLEQLTNFASSMQQGQPVKTNLTLYQNLMTDDSYLSKLTPAQLNATQAQLAPGDFKTVANRWRDLNDPTSTVRNDPGNLNFPAINNTLTSRLEAMGINAKPKSTDTDGNAYIGSVRQIVNDWVSRDQALAGHKFNDVETAKSIDNALAQNVTLRSTLFGIGGKTSTMPLLSIKNVSDVPDAARTAIVNDFKSRGITPSDNDVIRTFVGGRLASIQQNRVKH